jgi:hypothetical protein
MTSYEQGMFSQCASKAAPKMSVNQRYLESKIEDVELKVEHPQRRW